MKGNLIWSMRTQTAKFIEDESGQFEIADGQIVPIIKEVVKIVDNSAKLNKLIRLQEETNLAARNAEWHASGGNSRGWAADGW